MFYKLLAFLIIVIMSIIAHDVTRQVTDDTATIHQKQVVYTFCDEGFTVPLEVIESVEHKHTHFLELEAVCKDKHYILVVNAMRYGTKVYEFGYR